MILSHLLSSYYKTKSASTLSRGSKVCDEVDMGPLIIHTVIILCLWYTYIIYIYIACLHTVIIRTSVHTLHAHTNKKALLSQHYRCWLKKQKQTKTQDKTRKKKKAPFTLSWPLGGTFNSSVPWPHHWTAELIFHITQTLDIEVSQPWSLNTGADKEDKTDAFKSIQFYTNLSSCQPQMHPFITKESQTMRQYGNINGRKCQHLRNPAKILSDMIFVSVKPPAGLLKVPSPKKIK